MDLPKKAKGDEILDKFEVSAKTYLPNFEVRRNVNKVRYVPNSSIGKVNLSENLEISRRVGLFSKFFQIISDGFYINLDPTQEYERIEFREHGLTESEKEKLFEGFYKEFKENKE